MTRTAWWRRLRRAWMLLGLALVGLAAPQAWAAEPPPLAPQVRIVFGDSVTILLPLAELGPVQRVEIYLRPEGMVDTYTADMVLDRNQARYEHPVQEKPLPLFGQVFYWFKIYPAQGAPYQSPAFTFVYEDNRFAWQSRTVAPVQVYWYAGGADVAEMALNAAHIALKNAFVQWQGRIATDRPLRIYIYASPRDLTSALATLPPELQDHETRLAQHTVLTYDGLSPQARAEQQRYIAHQVAHIVLYDTVGEGYVHLPWWLREGLAALAEPQAAATEYQVLQEAAAANQLYPLRDLCREPTFATEDDERLARAEAGSFVAHVFARYGPAGLQRLLEVYTSGLGCEEGFQAALGASLTALEDDWRAAQGLFPRREIEPGWVGLWVMLWMLAPFAALGWWHWRTRRPDVDFTL